MNINEFEKNTKSVEGIENIIKSFTETFDRIDEFGYDFKAGSLHGPADTVEIMTEATGYYVQLNVLSEIAEYRYQYIKEKIAEEKKENIVGGFKSDDLLIAMKLRNIFRGYKSSCDKIISTCQSRLKIDDREQSLD